LAITSSVGARKNIATDATIRPSSGPTPSLSAVRRSEGTIDALIAIMTDMTSRKEAEAAL
jgi:hypothetical protein